MRDVGGRRSDCGDYRRLEETWKLAGDPGGASATRYRAAAEVTASSSRTTAASRATPSLIFSCDGAENASRMML